MEKFAFYLPQFHRCEKNDEFWEEGFTDWVTTTRAKPLFDWHNQPIVPGELGYYDLESEEIIFNQAKLAKDHGLDGFAIYHYCFDKDVTAIDKPIKILRDSPEIDISYFICWVNWDWTKSWIGDNNTVIFKQKYSNEMYEYLFDNLTYYFSDSRYRTVDGKPVLYIYSPLSFDVKNFIDKAENYFKDKGYSGITWIAPRSQTKNSQMSLFDYLVGYPLGDSKISYMKRFPYFHALMKRIAPKWLLQVESVFKYLNVYNYNEYNQYYINHSLGVSKQDKNFIPTAITNWDNSPRYGINCTILDGSTPQSAAYLISELSKIAKDNGVPFMLIKAWNEWAEGNLIEPCEQYGRGYLEEISKIDI